MSCCSRGNRISWGSNRLPYGHPRQVSPPARPSRSVPPTLVRANTPQPKTSESKCLLSLKTVTHTMSMISLTAGIHVCAGGLQSGLSCAAFTCAISVFIDKMQPEAATASEGFPLSKVNSSPPNESTILPPAGCSICIPQACA